MHLDVGIWLIKYLSHQSRITIFSYFSFPIFFKQFPLRGSKQCKYSSSPLRGSLYGSPQWIIRLFLTLFSASSSFATTMVFICNLYQHNHFLPVNTCKPSSLHLSPRCLTWAVPLRNYRRRKKRDRETMMNLFLILAILVTLKEKLNHWLFYLQLCLLSLSESQNNPVVEFKRFC